MVMSLAENGDLRRVVTDLQASRRLLPEPVALSYAYQTLNGLRFLHGQGVIHRDLKSSNIFLCEGRRRIRIGDFGISKVLESTEFAVSLVGTPAYMSPELMRGERYDYHVDMWALGCIVFEICTLSLPFRSVSLIDLAAQVTDGSPDWTLWDQLGFTDELRDVSHRLLQKEVALRPTPDMLMEEPLFLPPNGRGAQAPPEEAWLTVGLQTLGGSPDKRLTRTQLSDASTEGGSSTGGAASASTGTGSGASSGTGRWAPTTSMDWEATSRSTLYGENRAPYPAVVTNSMVTATDSLPRELLFTDPSLLKVQRGLPRGGGASTGIRAGCVDGAAHIRAPVSERKGQPAMESIV